MPQKRKKKKEKNPFSMEFLDSREKRKKERKKKGWCIRMQKLIIYQTRIIDPI